MPASENEIQLFTSKPVIRYISQFWADILEFGGHLGFHSTWNLYIWFLCIHHNTFWHEYQLCSSISRRTVIHCRQPFWVLTAILNFGCYNLCPGDFFEAMYIANISWLFQAGIRNLNINFQKKTCDYLYRSILDSHFGISPSSWFLFSLGIHIFEFSVLTAYILT